MNMSFSKETEKGAANNHSVRFYYPIWTLECGLQIQLLKLMYWVLHVLLNTNFKPLLLQIYVCPQKQNS